MDSRLKLEAAKRDAAAAQTSQTAAAPTAPAAPPPPPLRTPNSVASSRVQTLEIISQGHCDDGGVLQFGQLLQWMDIAACLSAERHAHLNAVTLVMDDLSVESVAVRVGDIVRLEGVVNAAFSSSMEVGVTVHAESPGTAGERPVCSAGFIFVALAPDGKKVKLAPVVPDTVEERHAYQLACERRGLRQKRAKLEAEAEAALKSEVAKVQRAGQADPAEGSAEASALLIMRKACAEEMTELVLPQHANHHGNTFGGQLMAWMAEAATIAASRQARSHLSHPAHVTINIFDAMKFIAPSKVGGGATHDAQIPAHTRCSVRTTQAAAPCVCCYRWATACGWWRPWRASLTTRRSRSASTCPRPPSARRPSPPSTLAS